MKRKYIFAFINAIVFAIILLHNNCTYRGQSTSSANKESTIIGNPMTTSKIAQFKAIRPETNITVCLAGYNFIQSQQATTISVDPAVSYTISENGATLGNVEAPANSYKSVEMLLDNRCNQNFSLLVKNKNGEFKTTAKLNLNFMGDVVLNTKGNIMTFNIQAVFDSLENVASDADLLQAIRNSGMVSTPDLWASLNLDSAPSARNYNGAAWTGRELIIWGGYSTGIFHNDGAVYNPISDQWRPINEIGAPSSRYVGSSVWTGTRMIVWGGVDFMGLHVNSGAIYEPYLDQWFATSLTNAPTARMGHTAIWSGSKMIIWGGEDSRGQKLNTGAAYDPQSNTWSTLSTTNAPTARMYHSAIWTGNEMIIWGGCNEVRFDCSGDNAGMNTGAKYNPDTDTWTPVTMLNAPSMRYGHYSVWTGTRMLVWSGNQHIAPYGSFLANDGGQYDPTSDSWLPITPNSGVTPRVEGIAVWTGSQMLIWGGRDYNFKDINTSALYDPVNDSWKLINPLNAPKSRRLATGFWTGFEILVWGGWQGGADYLNSGGRYRP